MSEIRKGKAKPYGCSFSFIFYLYEEVQHVGLSWVTNPFHNLNMTSYARRDMNVFRLKPTLVYSKLSDRFEYIWNPR
jgi:hypothetical protein